MNSLYEYKDYKKFILDFISKSPQKGRGLRKLLSKALNCQMAFITQVLGGDYNFSLEQAEACARWLDLSENESDFFILLVMHERAATKNLKSLISRQLSEKRLSHANLKKRINSKETLSIEDQILYYSQWQFAAVHMAVLNPQLRTIEALQDHFNIPLVKLLKMIEFLVNKGFLARENQILKPLKPVLHLDLSSPLLTQHHSQWRIKSIEAVNSKVRENLHYSGVISLSLEDFDWVREKLSILLKEIVDKISNSPDEKLACLNFDWFEI